MGRRSSGQVLIGAATLMLVILLTMAASLPVINTSIDPSSEAMNVMVAISETLAKRAFLEMGAAQCANEMIGKPTFSISTTVAVGVSKARSTFIERLRKLYPGAGIKDLNIEVLESSITQSSSRLEGISVSIHIEFRVTYYVDKGNTKVFKKFIYKERFFAGADVYVKTNIVNDLKSAMPGWLDTAIGFIPVIGDLKDILGAREYFTYTIGFNVGRAIWIGQYDASGKFVGSASKGEGATPSYDLTLREVVDHEVNKKLTATFLNRPKESYKVYLGWPLTIQWNRKVIELTEYYNVDWVTVALAIIGLIPIGDLAKARSVVRQDLSRDNGSDDENILSFSKIPDNWGDGFGPRKVQPINPIRRSAMDNQGRLYQEVDWSIIEDKYTGPPVRELLKARSNEVLEDLQKEAPATKPWIERFLERIVQLINSILGSSSSSDLGKLGDGDWTLNSMVQQELLQNSGSRSKIKLFNDQDPFMWIVYPRPGGGAYSACLWLEDFYPTINK